MDRENIKKGAGVLFVFLVTGLLFFLYDRFVEGESNKENKDESKMKSGRFRANTTTKNDMNMMYTKTDGNIETISLEKILPKGTIVAWKPSAINASPPEGWAICNGTNGTPDLRGRFVLGWNPKDQTGVSSPNLDRTVQNNIGEIGGERTHTLTAAELPPHKHNYHKAVWGTGDQGGEMGGSYGDKNIKKEETGDGAETLKSTPHNNVPPYVVLAYIMKL